MWIRHICDGWKDQKYDCFFVQQNVQHTALVKNTYDLPSMQNAYTADIYVGTVKHGLKVYLSFAQIYVRSMNLKENKQKSLN